MVLETLKEKIRSIKEEYEEFYGLLAWQPEKDEKELGFLVRACFDESIQIKKMDKGVSANITLFMVLIHPIYINNSLIFSDRTFTRPARLYIENELIRLVEIKE